MITRTLYDKIREKHGSYASWAVWEPRGDKPKSNMGVQNVFNLESNPSLLGTLRNDIVMVGLNFSRELNDPPLFSNFHPAYPQANDFKIRFAFRDTPYYGAYMTDVLKNLAIPNVQRVRDYNKKNPDVLHRNIRAFEEELEDLESHRPMLLAFGQDAHGLLKRHLDWKRYSSLILLTHYSYYMGKEEYREDVHRRIAESLSAPDARR